MLEAAKLKVLFAVGDEIFRCVQLNAVAKLLVPLMVLNCRSFAVRRPTALCQAGLGKVVHDPLNAYRLASKLRGARGVGNFSDTSRHQREKEIETRYAIWQRNCRRRRALAVESTRPSRPCAR